MNFFKTSFLLLLFNTQTSVQAINFIKDSVKVYDTIVVKNVFGSRISLNQTNYGGNITVLSHAEIIKLPAQNCTEILSYILGVDIRQRGPSGIQADAQIQGSSFDQVLVLVDGVRMSDPQTGHHQLNLSISPNAIDRIEIIKGAASRRYGLNAYAGVINIITINSGKSQGTFNIFQGSSFSKNEESKYYKNQGYRFFRSIGTKNSHVWYNLDIDFGNGYRHNSDFQSIRSNFKISENFKIVKREIQLSIIGGMIKNGFGANGFYAATSDSNAYEYVNTQWGAISSSINIFNGLLSTRLSGRLNNDHYIFKKENPSFYQNFHQTFTINPEINFRKSFKKFDFAIGTEYRRENINSTNLGLHNKEYSCGYIDLLYKPLNWISLSTGLYMLNQKQLGTKYYPGADIFFKINRQLNVYASIGTGQRLATYTDLYYQGPSNIGNPNLEPEKSLYYDAGIRFQNEHWGFNANIFQRQNSNLIDRIKDSATAPWRPINIESFIVNGIETKLTYRNIIRIFKTQKTNLKISSGLNYMDTKYGNLNSVSQYKINFLPIQWLSSFEIYQKNILINLQIRHIERIDQSIANTSKYNVLDLKLEYKFFKTNKFAIKGWVNIQNISNEKYREFSFVPLLPRWTVIGSTIDF